MILEDQRVYKRYVACPHGSSSHRLDKTKQKGLFLEGLARGAALVSPDELSYFRIGCELDGQEEHNIYHGLSGFGTSALLLTEHRLFGTYWGLNFIKEASLQIAVSFIYVVHEAINTLFSLIKLTFSLLAMICTFGFNATARDWVKSSTQETFSHLVKTCASIPLFVTGVLGALITRPLSSLLSPYADKTNNSNVTSEEVTRAMKKITCNDRGRVEKSIRWLRDSNRTNRGTTSRLERVVGSLSDAISETRDLKETIFTVRCNEHHCYTPYC